MHRTTLFKGLGKTESESGYCGSERFGSPGSEKPSINGRDQLTLVSGRPLRFRSALTGNQIEQIHHCSNLAGELKVCGYISCKFMRKNTSWCVRQGTN